MVGGEALFPYLCDAISVTLPRKMPLVTLLLDADYTVIWRKSHGFSIWFYFIICLDFRNSMNANAL